MNKVFAEVVRVAVNRGAGYGSEVSCNFGRDVATLSRAAQRLSGCQEVIYIKNMLLINAIS